jgi:hypothetical protein
LKYRFINETPSIPQLGVFPLVEIPTGNAAKQLGSGDARLFFPVWLQKSWGAWTTYGGGGYLADIASASANSWSIGWEGQRDISKLLTLGAELFGTLFPSNGSQNEASFAIGAIVNFSDNHHALFSAGRDLWGHNDLLLYAAYQYTVGPSSP